MQDKLWQDEREWQNEFGILPSGIDRYGKMLTSTAKVSNAESKNGGKLVNLTEFSGYLAGNNTANCSTMSLGQYFSKRCEDIREIIPSKSPTKTIPIALLGDSYRSGSEYNSSCGSKKYSQGICPIATHISSTIDSINFYSQCPHHFTQTMN